MADPVLHEVYLELSSGSRVLVGTDLPDVATANALARHWRQLAETEPDLLHETLPGSGCIVRGAAIVAIKAQHQAKPGMLKPARTGVWL